MKIKKSPIEDERNEFFLKFTIFIIIICCIGLAASYTYNESGTSNETKIIKVKNEFTNGLTDNCGHPMQYLNIAPKPLLGETYEIILTTRKDNEFITNITQVDKEKYKEDCSKFI